MKIGDIVLAGQKRYKAVVMGAYGSRVEVHYLNKEGEPHGKLYVYDKWKVTKVIPDVYVGKYYTLGESTFPVKVLSIYEDWAMVRTSRPDPEVVLITELTPFDKKATMDRLLTEIAKTLSLNTAKMAAIDLRDIIEMT